MEHMKSQSCQIKQRHGWREGMKKRGCSRLLDTTECSHCRVWRWLEVWRRGRGPCPIAAAAHMACSELLLIVSLPRCLLAFLTPPIAFSGINPCKSAVIPSRFYSSLSPFFPLFPSSSHPPSLQSSFTLYHPFQVFACPCPASFLLASVSSLLVFLQPLRSFSLLFCSQLCSCAAPRQSLFDFCLLL